MIRINPSTAFYQTPARFWELAAGGLVAAARPIALPRCALFGALVLIAIACCWPAAHFPGLGAIPVVLASAIALAAVNAGGELGWGGAILRSWPMVSVGKISYSLYLWHWPLLAFYRATTVGAVDWRRCAGLCAAALVLAILSYRYVETPFRRLRSGRIRSVAAGACASVMVVLGSVAFAHWIEAQEASHPSDNPLAAMTDRDLPPDWRRCHYQVWSTEFPRPGCASTPDLAPALVLWGDSMAMSWKPFAWELAQRTRTAAIDYSRDACRPFIEYLPTSPMPADIKCHVWNKQVLERALQADTVILSGRWMGEFEADMRATLQALAPHVRRVLILGPTPQMRDTVPHCIRANALDACSVTRAQFERDALPLRDQLKRASSSLANVEIIDPTDFFCTSDVCPPLKDGYGLYRDAYHVSATASASFARTWHEADEQAAVH